MTSANVINYTIRDLKGEKVGSHYQHLLCATKWGKLLAFEPAENFTITAWGEDEEEEPWEDEPMSLKVFIDRLIESRHKFNT